MKNIRTISVCALMLALGLVMPFLTAQVPQIGSMLLPMHLPVLLAGYIVGGAPAMAVGAVVPLLRSFIWGMPPLYPTAVAMAFELAAYGFFAGFLYEKSNKSTFSVYASLIGAMLAGRVVWGAVSRVLYTMSGSRFTIQVFIAGAFLNAIPGIVLQIVLIPVLVMALKRAKIIR